MQPTDDGSTHAPPTLLRNRNFVLLWCAYAISAFGDHVSEMAILKTQGVSSSSVAATPMMAKITFLFFVPFLLFGPLMGLLADRRSRRGTMVVADLFRAVIVFFLASLIGWAQDWGDWGPFLPLLLIGLFASAFSPARGALLPTLIHPDQLIRANGMISGLGIIATMAAMLVGGYLAKWYPAEYAFRTDAATYIVSAACLLMIWRPSRATSHGAASHATPKPILRQLRSGFSYARTHRRVLELIAVAAVVWGCGALVRSVVPAIVRDVYGGDLLQMSAYQAFIGLGFIIGAILITVLGDALRSEIAITWSLFGISAGVMVFALSVFLPLAPAALAPIGAVGLVLSGMFAVGTMASLNALLQRIVPDRFRGRVFGVKDLCTTAALLLASGSLGIPGWKDVDAWVGWILVGVAGFTSVAAAVTLRVRLQRGPFGKSLTFAENLNEFIAKFWWRLKRIGKATLPREGPVIITANHTCSVDPLLLHAAAPYRPIAFMVAAEYSEWPIVRFFLKLVECIPVRRDGRDTAATKHAVRHLRAGKALGIFIEGQIIRPGTTPKPKDGVAMLALKTGTQVIPAHISGVQYRDGVLHGLFTRHRARVRFGPPVDLSEFGGAKADRATLRAATRKIYDAIQALAPPGERRDDAVFDAPNNHAKE